MLHAWCVALHTHSRSQHPTQLWCVDVQSVCMLGLCLCMFCVCVCTCMFCVCVYLEFHCQSTKVQNPRRNSYAVNSTQQLWNSYAVNSKTLGGIHTQSTAGSSYGIHMQSTAAMHIYTLALCIYCACAYEYLAAPSRPSPVSRLFHAVCTSS